MRTAFRLAVGFSLFVWYILSTRSVYLGQRAFYRVAQAQGWRGWAASFVLDGPLALLVVDRAFAVAHRDRDRLSDRARETYSTDDLAGYGSAVFDKDGDVPLTQQQRGLILSPIETVLAELPAGARIVEIGCGNGDVLADIAARHPQHDYLGIDFSVRTAADRHPLVTWRAGYALDIIAEPDFRADLLFASSTFIFCTPKELAGYCERFAQRGIGTIVLSEPLWGGYALLVDDPPVSAHLESAVWMHHFAGYLARAGYTIQQWSLDTYQPGRATRPDLMVMRLIARLATAPRRESAAR